MEIAAFTLIDVPDAGLSTAYLEGPTADIFMDDTKDVTMYRRSFEHLRKAALNSPDSRALITEIAEGLST